MSIRFPQMHIAKSTVNRIMNAADEIEQLSLPLPSIDVPNMPESDPAGAAIDVAVNTPPDPVAAPEGTGIADIMGPEGIL